MKDTHWSNAPKFTIKQEEMDLYTICNMVVSLF